MREPRTRSFLYRAATPFILLSIVPSCGSHDAGLATGHTAHALVGDNDPLPVPGDTVVPPDEFLNKHVVDSLPGYSEVTPDGQSRYSIPLWVSPGRAGMAPILALEYSSRGPNGLLGVGWSLTGFSEITRCARTVATDGYAASVKFDDTDAFCMNGQHLKKIAGPLPGGKTIYHTERDTFARVVANAGNDGPIFTVYEKNGRVDEYTGYKLGRKKFANWFITKSSDRYGNTIAFSYSTDPHSFVTSGGRINPVVDYVYPDRIDYTGSDNKLMNLSANRYVKFTYEDRLDHEYFGASGSLDMRKRLASIEVWGPDAQMKSALLRKYTLKYLPDGSRSITKRSLLASVITTDADNHSLQTTDFEWEKGTWGFARSDSSVTDYSSSQSLRGFQLGDINQDGYADLLYVIKDSNGDPEWAVRLWNPGAADFGNVFELHLKPSKDRGGQYTFPRAALSNNNSMGILLWGNPTATNWSEPKPLIQQVRMLADGSLFAGEYAAFDPSGDFVLPADFDGDGLADVMTGWIKSSAPIFQFSRNTGQTSVNFATGVLITPPAGKVLMSNGSTTSMRAVDFDGDGRQEIVLCYDVPTGAVPAYTITSNGAVPYAPFVGGGVAEKRGLLSCDVKDNAIYTDFNRDGLDDVLYPANSKSGFLNVNPGPTSVADNIVGHSMRGSGNYLDQDGASSQLIDYNLDGRADVMSTAPTFPVKFDYFDGNGLSQIFYDPNAVIIVSKDNEVAVGDVTGDGLEDIVQLESGRLAIYTRKGKKPDVMTRVVDGFGGETKFTYQPITSSVVYTPARSAYEYPLRNVNGGLWVVSKQEVSNGVTTQPTAFFHKYAQGIDDVQRGFLGFNSHEVLWYDQQRARVRRETYDNVTRFLFVEPFSGLPTVVDTVSYDTNGAVVHEELVKNAYQMHWHDDLNIYFPYAASSQSVQMDPDATGKLVVTAKRAGYIDQIDDYGNVAKSRTVTGAFNFDVRELNVTYAYSSAGWRTDLQWLINQPTKIVETGKLDVPPSGPRLTRTTALLYDGSGGLAWQIEEPSFDANGQVVPLPQPQWDGVQSLFSRYTRDPDGQIASMTQDSDFTATAHQRVQTLFRDGADRVFVTRTKNKVGHVVHMAMHPGLGVLAATQDENGNYSRWQYDTFGRVKRSEPSGGEPITTKYYGYSPSISADAAKTPLEVDKFGDAGDATYTQFDLYGRAIVSTTLSRNDGSAVTTETKFDEFGRVVSTSRPHFDKAAKQLDKFFYDAAGRLHRRELADGRIEQLDYSGFDGTGLQIDHYDADPSNLAAVKSTTTYDYGGRLDSSVEHAAAKSGRPARDVKVQYSYGPFANLTTVFSVSGGLTDMVYDRRGRKISLTDPSHGSRAYAYSAFGELISETISDTSGNAAEVRNRHYDDLGRPIALTTRDGLTSWTWDTAPNGIGKLASTASSSGILRQFGYDTHGYLADDTYVVDNRSYSLTTVRDGFGRVSKVQYPTVNGGRFAVRYEYGPHNALQAIKDDATNQAFWSVIERSAGNLAINPTGAFAHYSFGDGIGTVHFNEDPSRPGLLKTVQSSAATTLQSLTYGFDKKGYLQSRKDAVSGLQETFDYDELNRVEHWNATATSGKSRVRFDYDDVGNLKGRVYEIGAGPNLAFDYTQERGAGPYAVSAVGAKQFSYDIEGNQSQAGSRHVAAAAFGLPLGISDQASYEFHYDADNNRVQKKIVSGSKTDDTVTLRGLYQRHSVNGDGAEHLYTIASPDGPVAQVKATEGKADRATFYILRDHLGNADTILDGAGKRVETRKFDPYGNRIDPKNPLGAAPARIAPVTFGFAGHEHDWELGLVNMRGRMYDPTTGRFLSPDPLVQSPLTAGGLNSYSYVLNRPTTLVDPMGFRADEVDPGATDAGLPPIPPLPPGPPAPTPVLSDSSGVGLHVHVNAVDPAETRAANGAADRLRGSLTESDPPVLRGSETFALLGVVGVVCPECLLIYGAVYLATHVRNEDDTGAIISGALMMAGGAAGLSERAVVNAAAAPTGEVYGVAFEMKLNPAEIGARRSVHFNRANAALDATIQSDAEFATLMEDLIPGVGKAVTKTGGRTTPAGWMWHHAQEVGVMQLVEKIQHTAGSIFWNVMHPGNRGGYSLWAIPAGAPKN